MYSLSQAAKATGKAKATIHRNLMSGRISGIRTGGDGWQGGWQIDPAELHRVFPPIKRRKSPNGAERTPAVSRTDPRDKLEPDYGSEKEADFLRDQLRNRDETIADLRSRLDRSEEERRKLSERLLPQPHRSWWQRLRGKGS